MEKDGLNCGQSESIENLGLEIPKGLLFINIDQWFLEVREKRTFVSCIIKECVKSENKFILRKVLCISMYVTTVTQWQIKIQTPQQDQGTDLQTILRPFIT